VKGNRLGSDHDDAGVKPTTQVKPYAIVDPIAFAALASRRRFLRTKWRYTTKAAREHPLNEHEYRRARRAGVAHGALLVAVVFAGALVWGWLSFCWDALKAVRTARHRQPHKAQAVLEGTLALTAALTVVSLMTEGWGLLQAVEAAIVFGLFTFPLVCALVLRRDIRWVYEAREKKELAGKDDDGDDPPLLTLGETALPPGLARARGMRGDDDA